MREYRNYLWIVEKKTGKILNEPEPGNDHCMDALRYAMITLEKIEPQKDYWNRLWEKELNPKAGRININRGR